VLIHPFNSHEEILMSDSIFRMCKPPAVYVCTEAGCECEPRPVNAVPVPQVCPPTHHLVCAEGACTCQPLPQQPIVFGEPVGQAIPDGCTLLLTLAIAGFKKALVACWVNG
jgi:hypothetical protein